MLDSGANRHQPAGTHTAAGLQLTDFTGTAGFSGSHDTTAKLVEAGTYQAGALNAAVWDDRVKTGKIDTGKVTEIFRTLPYHDYHWLIRPDVDQKLGNGFTKRVADTLLGIDGSDERQRTILELFQAKKFISTDPANYAQIESVARSSGLLR